MKKIFGIAITGVATTVLASCGGGRASNEFQFATWAVGQELTEFNEIIDTVNENAAGEYTVELLSIPADYYVKISTMIAGDKSPDFFWLTQEVLGKYADLGAIVDLTEYMNASEDMKPEDFYPGVIESAHHFDSYWGIPWISNPAIIYYNKDIFRQAGYTDETMPAMTDQWTWDEFVDTVYNVSHITGTDQYGTLIDGLVNVETFLWSGGDDGGVIAPDGKTVILDSDDSKHGMTYLYDLLNIKKNGRYITPEYKDIPSLGSADLWFTKQKAAMFFGGIQDTFEKNVAALPEDQQFEIGYAPVPTTRDGGAPTFNWTATTVISEAVQDEDLAYKALEDISREFMKWKIAPPLKSADLEAVLAEYRPEKLPMIETMQYALNNTKSGKYVPEWNKIDLWYGLYQPITTREWTTIDQYYAALDSIAADARKILA